MQHDIEKQQLIFDDWEVETFGVQAIEPAAHVFDLYCRAVFKDRAIRQAIDELADEENRAHHAQRIDLAKLSLRVHGTLIHLKLAGEKIEPMLFPRS